ncbi:MAG: class I SAM-dependent methyltransferase [Spirochaetales bacterium]|nr:class I SAM-dependent methyltransferase [Spirochaetales bacterium]
METKKIVESIENRWDILFSDYPEVYDEFAKVPREPDLFKHLVKMFNFSGKDLLDVGSGSGLSGFEISPYCSSVIGVEPEDAMRDLAIQNAKKRNCKNVRFIKGVADNIPLEDDSVDISLAITCAIFEPDEIRRYVKEQLRVVRKGGLIIKIDIAPKWYGGELAPVILGRSRTTEEDTEGTVDKIVRKEFGFEYKDFYQHQDYGTLDKIVGTYGFIFGSKVIAYLKKKNKTTVKWKTRIFYKMCG